ncbi:sushi, von Willebrand factor type A, EGF and pentraxin domain-containing 1-like isoform X4, partial [Paramuricea clavata]
NLCDENAEAHEINGVVDCFCKRGYYGNGKICTDIDECRITCACSEEQECVNWPGSYSCETQEPEGPCDENAEAHMINGAIDCFCKRGYYGNGKTCSDIDECRISCACSGGQECVNWPGSYQCQGLPELAKIGFEHSLYPVTEDSSSVEICLDVKNSQEPISGWITTNGGAAVTGADYLSIREVVNITDSQESTCYTIPILDDDEFEGNETFSVVLTLNANVSGVQESYDEATVIIVDDD